MSMQVFSKYLHFVISTSKNIHYNTFSATFCQIIFWLLFSFLNSSFFLYVFCVYLHFPECTPGFYGAGCKLRCNCPTDVLCDHETGACKHQCPPGFHGEKCHLCRYSLHLSLGGILWMGKLVQGTYLQIYKLQIKGYICCWYELAVPHWSQTGIWSLATAVSLCSRRSRHKAEATY